MVKFTRILSIAIFSLLASLVFLFSFSHNAFAQSPTPEPCLKGQIRADGSINNGSYCPDLTDYVGVPYACAENYDSWVANKAQNFWVNDDQVTALGKAGERSRQFLYWTLTHRSIDNHPVLLSVWSFAKDMVYFFLIVVAAVFGLGIIIGQRANFNLKLEVWPLILKIGLLFLYVTFSASVVLLIIQLSDTLMLFFIERLGVTELFNIFFLAEDKGSVIKNSETAYQTFMGCTNLNNTLLDSVQTSKFMVNITNMTYYMIGVMMILRKIILWLLLFVSPFLALLMPFVFIRNTGWIWIGVFFQWVFYGPLFALFLGGLATIWNAPSHIPFNFDFSRANTIEGFIYPTTINILYGGPAQHLKLLNSSNYVDTFAEYIISLLMLWAVTFFPWWLLRIFRDYCCDGIYAMKNILLSMYDQTRGGPGPQPPAPTPTPAGTGTGTAIKMPQEIEIPVKVKLETTEEIKRARTEDITRSLNISVSKLTDIARFETQKQHNEVVNKNLNYLQNPLKAETPTERQKYMNIRSELFSRAVKEDKIAKQILSSLSTSKVDQVQKREELIQSISQPVPVTRIVSIKVKMPNEKVNSVTSQLMNSVSQNTSFVNSVAQASNIPQQSVKTILSSYVNNVSKPANEVVSQLSNETSLSQQQVSQVIQNTSNLLQQTSMVRNIAKSQSVSSEDVQNILNTINQTFEQNIVDRPMSQVIEESTKIPPQKQVTIVKSFLNSTAANSIIQNQLKQVTNLNENQISSIVQNFVENISQPSTTIINNVSTQTGIEKEKVKETITSLVNTSKSVNDISKEIAQKENIKEDDVNNIIQAQMPLVAEPEKHVEETISIPPSVSLDDYEQVKKMWKDQYERGEVPISTRIQSREQWLGQDVVLITNTLNKLVSNSPELRQEGLDDVGSILPIFLINNLKGDELLVYLKAKLEAAKEVITDKEKEKEIKEKVGEKKEEEFVDVERPKTEAKQKEMKMEEEVKENPNDNPPVGEPSSKTDQNLKPKAEEKNVKS